MGGAVSYERGTPVVAFRAARGCPFKRHFERHGASIEEQLLYINVQRLQGGLEFKAHRLLYHSSVIKKKKSTGLTRGMPVMEGLTRLSGDTTPCKVTPVILHGVVSPDYTGLYPQTLSGTGLTRGMPVMETCPPDLRV